MQEAALLLVASSQNILWGVYQDTCLIKQGKEEQKTLDALICIWQNLSAKYKISEIYYARGPGSLSALKLLHIFVHTLRILRPIRLFATDHFAFNQNFPIHAFGNQYFYKEQSEVVLRSAKEHVAKDFCLPERICVRDFSQECTPLYIVPPIQQNPALQVLKA